MEHGHVAVALFDAVEAQGRHDRAITELAALEDHLELGLAGAPGAATHNVEMGRHRVQERAGIHPKGPEKLPAGRQRARGGLDVGGPVPGRECPAFTHQIEAATKIRRPEVGGEHRQVADGRGLGVYDGDIVPACVQRPGLLSAPGPDQKHPGRRRLHVRK